MTPEQMENAFNFIVEQQAQFAVDIQQLKEAQVTTEMQMQELQRKLAESHQGLAKSQQGLAEAQTASEMRMATLSDAVISITTLLGRVAKDQEQTNISMAETELSLRTSQAETEERLKTFILVVERYINSRNGSSAS